MPESTHTAEIRAAILESVFPDLKYGGDPDIERYFELREAGRVADALAVYHGKLRVRYPDDSKRIELLGLFRRRDPRFAGALRAQLDALADSLVGRVRAAVDALLRPLAGVAPHDAYGTLKAVERVVDMLPPDESDAIRVLDLHVRHAALLAHRRPQAERLRFLVGEFFAQSRADEYGDDELVARSYAKAEERRRAEGKRNFFDLSRIEFSKEDVARIEIPSGIERREDRVLAFCHKYWLRATDPGFERVVNLYSRKYGTEHYSVLRAIRVGRAKRYTDDEILNLVDTILSSSYSYSVQGDLYMRSAWKALKARLYGTAPATHVASPPRKPATVRGTVRRAPAAPGNPALREGAAHDARPGATQTQTQTQTPKIGSTLERAEEPRLSGRRDPERFSLTPAPKPAPPTNGISPAGSVSDMLRKLSGRAYDVYRDSFATHAPAAVEEVISAARGKRKSIFDDSATKAERIILDFLSRNYANPFMDWENSEARSRVAELGYALPSLEPVIQAAWKRIR
ncbi:MAG: hypothetical protein JXA15_09085 [Spirochaetales bacterium]|nr:hypothetical protein [Spirochaetales bacterium]